MNEELIEYYGERSSIMHIDGGIPEAKADALAMAEVETWAKAKGIEFSAEAVRTEWIKRRAGK